MPSFEVTALNENIWEAIDAAKANHPDYIYPDSPEFQQSGLSTTAIVHARIDPNYVPEEVPEEPEVTESATCEHVQRNGNVCGRGLPCRRLGHRN